MSVEWISVCLEDEPDIVYPEAGGCVLNLAEERAVRLALEAENRQLRERLR